MAYFAEIGPSSGLLRHRAAPATANVQEARDGPSVGVATLVGRDPTDIALWRLVVHGVELDGLFVISGMKFRPEQ